jgi:hypothetical protein
MEQRVMWSIGMLCGVLGLVYRALFRSIDMDAMMIQTTPSSIVRTSAEASTKDPLAGFLDESSTIPDPFRDASPEPVTPPLPQPSRVQVVNANNEPVVIDGMRFYSSTDLFDGTDTGSVAPQSSIPSMYIWTGTPKILEYL